MKHTEQTPKKPTATTGLFALLGSLLRVKGTRAPKIIRGTGAPNAGRGRLVTLAALAGTLGVLLFVPAVAQAGTGYVYSFSFTSPEGLSGPVGLAVDGSGDASAGDVYVIDQGNEALKKFSISGETATQEWKVVLSGAWPNQAVVDDVAGSPYEGDVFVAGYGNGTIYRVNAAGTEVVEVLTGLANPTGVAVDSAGNFFVSSIAEGTVLEYNANWEPIDAAGVKVFGAGENIVMKELNNVQTLAVSATGENIYAATAEGTIEATLMGTSYMTTGKLDEAGSNGVTVAPSGDVFVDQGNEVAFYEPSGARVGRFGSGVLSGAAFGVGVSASAALVADNGANDVEVFAAAATPETPETLPASAITNSSAVLNGKLKPAAGEPTVKYFFEYKQGPGCSGGTKTPEREGSGAVSEAISGLVLGTEYTFCLIAVNSVGESVGASQTFTTVAVGSEDSPSVTANEAEVSALIGTDGETTTYRVQYGTSSVEEAETATVSIPGASAPVPVEQRLGGLKPSTTYHFRFLVSNAHGHGSGEERTFTTPPAPVATTETCPNAKLRAEQPYGLGLPDCRAYEMVSPADTNGQDATRAEALGEGKLGLRASLAGNAIAYASLGAFASPAGAGEATEYLSRREAGGWTTQAITPIQDPREPAPTDPSYDGAVFTPELEAGIAAHFRDRLGCC